MVSIVFARIAPLAAAGLLTVLITIAPQMPAGLLTTLIGFAPPMPAAVARAQAVPNRPLPPLAPRWVYEPWVWEDEENDADAVVSLIDSYRQRDIPVGAVIIDSPWQTHYNTFEFNRSYPMPGKLMERLRDRDVRVVLWATGFINVRSIDGPNRDQAPNYQEALDRGYFVSGGQTFEWEKGEGSAIDFFNPDAVAWWYRQMDRAWVYGIDGWKVDNPEGNLPDPIQTAAGPKTNREYGDAYYRAFYQYVANRKPDGIIVARPYDSGTVYAPVDALPVGWVGDQIPDWGSRGIEEALDSILASAELGYAVVGSDIGGYRPGERFDKLFMRWAQLGALSPLMENGGRGEHRPWRLDADTDVVESYRYYATLHHELVPYLYGLGVEAHQGGEPIIRGVDRDGRQYRLGEDLLVAPVVTRDDRRKVVLPAGSRWYDYWDETTPLAGGTTLDVDVEGDRIPLYVRAGAIIPLQVSNSETGHGGSGSRDQLTLLVYPEGTTVRTLYPDDIAQPIQVSAERGDDIVSVNLGRSIQSYVMRIKEPAPPTSVSLTLDGAAEALPASSSWEAFNQADEGWYADADGGYVWVRFAAINSEAQIEYQPGR
jgi:alpha-glucosidase (family GH31 glycosyl hydrolase)